MLGFYGEGFGFETFSKPWVFPLGQENVSALLMASALHSTKADVGFFSFSRKPNDKLPMWTFKIDFLFILLFWTNLLMVV